MPTITETKVDDFWKKVLKGDKRECWPWQGGRTDRGYGRVRIVGFPSRRAHRIAWALSHGGGIEPPPDSLVLHRCHFRPCCNPAHLYLGDHNQNMEDRAQRTRRAKGLHQLRVDITVSLNERIDALATRQQRPKAELIREALESLLVEA